MSFCNYSFFCATLMSPTVWCNCMLQYNHWPCITSKNLHGNLFVQVYNDTIADLEPMSISMYQATASQGASDWYKFREGNMSSKIASIQQTHCTVVPCMMNGDNWLHHVISHILHITHSRWIFINVTLHNSIHGTLQLHKHKDILQEVEALLDTYPIGGTHRKHIPANPISTYCTNLPLSDTLSGYKLSKLHDALISKPLYCGHTEVQVLVTGWAEYTGLKQL